MIQAVTWKVKDLVSYDVTHAVVDCYPMPVSSKNKQQQVGVVAAREAVISNYVESIKSAALELNALDVHELVRCNLRAVQHSAGQSLALLTLAAGKGWLSVYHDTDLYVSREFMIGIDQLGQASSDDESVFDDLLLEIQRSLDYFESFYGMGTVTNLRIFPQLDVTEKMAMYLQNFSNFDIDFLNFDGDEDSAGIEAHCFHAYCAALRGSEPVIVQQINLYQERFKEKKLWISATQSVAALLLVIVIAAAWSYLLQSELKQAEQRNQLVKADRDRMTAELAAVNAEFAKLLEDNRIDLKIETTARQISARKRVLNFVEANRFGSGDGFFQLPGRAVESSGRQYLA